MSTGTELVMLLRGRAPLAVAMTASAQPNKVLTPRTTVARSKSGVSGRNIMYFIRGVSDHPNFDPTHSRTGWIGQPPILDRLEVVTIDGDVDTLGQATP